MPDNITVIMPWRATPNRIAAHERVVSYWDRLGLPVVHADSDAALPFNLAQARNRAAELAYMLYGMDRILIVADADSIPEAHRIHDAIEAVNNNHNLVVWPYRDYLYLPNDAVTQHDLRSVTPAREIRNGIVFAPPMILHTQTYWHLNGFDESFTQWGGEDDAFYMAADLLAETQRYDGTVWSFDHGGVIRKIASHPINFERYRKYLDVTYMGDPDEMRKLVSNER